MPGTSSAFPTLVYLPACSVSARSSRRRLDGTNEWQLEVVVPLVAPSTTILFTLLFIGVQLVRDSYVMVGLDGSPFGTTDVLGLVFYRTAFGNQSASIQNFGMGSALATPFSSSSSSSRPC